MGVKHTVRLSRNYAERKYVDLRAEMLRRAHESDARALTDTQLEDALEQMNDATHDGEGFENYVIERSS